MVCVCEREEERRGEEGEGSKPEGQVLTVTKEPLGVSIPTILLILSVRRVCSTKATTHDTTTDCGYIRDI